MGVEQRILTLPAAGQKRSWRRAAATPKLLELRPLRRKMVPTSIWGAES
jgi:hypothetical protein